jgi:hypothetical protein
MYFEPHNRSKQEVNQVLSGVYSAVKTNGENYYRASLTYQGKHISLGSYHSESDANQAYLIASDVLENENNWTIENYPSSCILPFLKWVVLINFRDNKIYFKNPIYLKKQYFLYYIDDTNPLKFSAEDLFYYAHHKIMKRGGHLFVSDYGMQVGILTRYGIKNYAIPGRDYLFINGDDTDYRYQNIEIINRYHGVTKVYQKGKPIYKTKIHINGDYLVGRYKTEAEAAIAYNKAALHLKNCGLTKNFPLNFIEGIDEIAYASIFQRVSLSKKFRIYAETFKAKE